MGYIEGNIERDGVPVAGVRVNLYRQAPDGARGDILATEVSPSKGGLSHRGVAGKGRYYFDQLDPGRYVVYLQGAGFDGERNIRDRREHVVTHNTGGVFLAVQVYNTWEDAKADWSLIGTGQPLFILSAPEDKFVGMLAKIPGTSATSYGVVNASGGSQYAAYEP